MAALKLNARHKVVLAQQVAAYNDSPTLLAAWFQDEDNAILHKFDAVKMCQQRYFQLVKALDPKEIAELREQYLAEFNDCPLAHKKVRVMELSKMYDSIDRRGLKKTVTVKGGGTEEVECSLIEETQAMQSILRDIKSEVGEDINRMQGDTNILIINQEQAQERANERCQKALTMGANVFIRRDN